jgi:putative two-component system response regulator
LPKILVIDDYQENISLIQTYFFGTNHNFISAESGKAGIKTAFKENPDLIMIDVQMPGMDGFQVYENLVENHNLKNIPIIMITNLEDNRSRSRCYELGIDYITKPFNIYDIKMRVNKLLELHNYKTQLESAERLIFHLASIVEAKDAYEKGATEKLAKFGVHFAKHIGLDENTIIDIYQGALLRSIGKIEVDEQILSKPGPLTEEEFNKVKSYPEIGEKICSNIKSLKNILPIIRYHKEQYDGSGYPEGLKGDNIPLNAQIISLGDCFTALISDRPYRKAFTVEKAINVMDKNMQHGKMNPGLYAEFRNVFSDIDVNEISSDFNTLQN